MMTHRPAPHDHRLSSPGLPAGLCCPECRGDVEWEGTAVVCARCGRRAILRGPVLLCGSASGTAESLADRILSWPDRFVRELGTILPGLEAEPSLPEPVLAELRAHGVIDQRSHLTELGRKIGYHLLESCRQSEQPDLQANLAGWPVPGRVPAILDVGCGAGQTLRHVNRSFPGERVGIDIDPVALTLGARLAGLEGQSIWFVEGTATELPFRNEVFTHVLSRVTLNYVHQARALREMARVVQPGGFLIVRAEGPGFDLDLIARVRGFRKKLGKCLDCLLGVTLAASGCQQSPGGRFRGGRYFATARGIGKVLRAAGCDVVQTSILARRLGLPTGFELWARRTLRGASPV